jgi:DNA-binding XRE family transcriptional regulator
MPSVESLIKLCEILDVSLNTQVIIEKGKKKNNLKKTLDLLNPLIK